MPTQYSPALEQKGGGPSRCTECEYVYGDLMHVHMPHTKSQADSNLHVHVSELIIGFCNKVCDLSKGGGGSGGRQ